MVMISDLKITIDVQAVQNLDIKVGDVVGLKSGGPIMTVESIGPNRHEGNEACICTIWFDDSDQLLRATFIVGVLKKHAD